MQSGRDSDWAELPFFIAIHSAYSQYSPRWLLMVGLSAGLTNGLAVLISGVYAQHVNMNAHVIWSYVIFFPLIPLFLASELALWSIKGALRRIGLWGRQEWWRTAVVVSSAVSLLGLVLFAQARQPFLSAVAMDIIILVALVLAHSPSAELIGSYAEVIACLIPQTWYGDDTRRVGKDRVGRGPFSRIRNPSFRR